MQRYFVLESVQSGSEICVQDLCCSELVKANVAVFIACIKVCLGLRIILLVGAMSSSMSV